MIVLHNLYFRIQWFRFTCHRYPWSPRHTEGEPTPENQRPGTLGTSKPRSHWSPRGVAVPNQFGLELDQIQFGWQKVSIFFLKSKNSGFWWFLFIGLPTENCEVLVVGLGRRLRPSPEDGPRARLGVGALEALQRRYQIRSFFDADVQGWPMFCEKLLQIDMFLFGY